MFNEAFPLHVTPQPFEHAYPRLLAHIEQVAEVGRDLEASWMLRHVQGELDGR